MNNLPVPLTSFIGRQREIAELLELLQSARLLTLTGAGGCGKTRLAIQLGAQLVEQFEHGVWWVALGNLGEEALVLQAIAQVLGVREGPGQSLLERLLHFLQQKHLLLILDDCDHLVEACARVSESLLTRCRDLRILATSRQALNMAGEREWIVPALALPARPISAAQDIDETVLADLAKIEAVRLFVDRAHDVRSGFELTARNAHAVVQICHRLDGIPLAIELAARIKLLTPEHLAERLHDRFSLLIKGSRTALPRHQTLRACIDWSYDLLPVKARTLLRRLSVFQGGFTLGAAETICASFDLPSVQVLGELTRLVDRSLVNVEVQGASERYRLLETIREYARERLAESGESPALCNNHLAHLLKRAQEGEPNVTGIEYPGWLEDMELEHDNLRAALNWAVESGATETGLALATALLRFWRIHGPVSEGRSWLVRFLSITEGSVQQATRARALFAAANLAWWQSEIAEARPLYNASLALGRELQDKRIIGWALFALGALDADEGKHESAQNLCREALVLLQQVDDQWGVSETRTVLALLAWKRRDTAEARRLFEEEIAAEREMGPGLGLANASCWLAYVELDDTEAGRAHILIDQALRIDQRVGAKNYFIDRLEAMAGAAVAQHSLARAARLLGASESLREEMNYPRNTIAQEFYTRHLKAVWTQIGTNPMLRQAWTEGQALSVEQAVEYALEQPDPKEEAQLQTLHVHLLGEFRLEYGQAPVKSVDSPRLQSLLAYLLLHRDAPQSRQHLAFLLYPDSSEKQARTNLRKLFHLLRQALPDADRFLEADGQTLQWRAEAPFMLDVARFEQAVKHAPTTAALAEAVELYHGELLQGCYDDWIRPERERLQQELIEALERLARQQQDELDYHAAINTAERLLHYDPLREETYRLLMRLHALRGDRAAVARVFNICVTTLRRELEVEPSRETRQLIEQLVQVEGEPTRVTRPGSRPTNLPIPLTSFIGRQQQVAEVKHLLSTARLLTLTGAGGSGKTRLALQVAHDLADSFTDGACWVELAALSDPALVPQEIARRLGVKEGQKRTLEEALQNFLRAKQLLLILDNCEHVLEACARLVHQLLSTCPRLIVLATSRELFGIAGESVFQVPTLSVPALTATASPGHLMQYESIALFVERAHAIKPDFKLTEQNAFAVAQVCKRLDGIPLAIELAAARTRLLKVENIAARLDDRFNLLTSGNRTALPRHQTLRGTIDWSYDLLNEEAQQLFRRLSIFAGGFTLQGAQVVCSDEGLTPGEVLEQLSRLVDRSLVMVDQQGQDARYWMLETIRQYAAEKLAESGQSARVRDRHLEFFVRFAEEAEPNLLTAGQLVWIKRIELEHDNIRAALKWSLEGGDAGEGLRLAAAMSKFWAWFWDWRANWSEGSRWLKDILAHTATEKRSAARAKALWGVSELAFGLGEFRTWRVAAEDSLAIHQELGDRHGMAMALMSLGWNSLYLGDVVTARPYFEQALTIARQMGDKWLLSYALRGVAGAIRRLDNAAALPLFEEALTLSREVGEVKELGESLYQLANVAFVQKDFSRAKSLYREAIALELRGMSKDGPVRSNLGDLLQMEGDIKGANTLYVEALTISRENGDNLIVATSLAGFAGVAAARGQPVRAARLLGAAEAQLGAMGLAFSRWPNRLEAFNRYIDNTRRQLDQDKFQAALVEGRAMTLEQTVAYVLEQNGG